MISSDRISKMSIMFSVQKLFLLKKFILIQLALKNFTFNYDLQILILFCSKVWNNTEQFDS